MLIALSLVACMGLLMLIVSGRRRAWWLIGLAPVLALVAHRFAPSRVHQWGIAVEDPPFVSATQSAMQPDDDVVGLHVGDTWYAYPYAELFKAPVIVQAGRPERIVLMWSAYANRVVAMHASMEVRAADIDIVSTPANATLIYNGRTGQFINALTGQTISGRSPSGFGSPIMVNKMRWKDWLATHPQTLVMDLHLPGSAGPSHPMEPIWPMPASAGQFADQRIAVVGIEHPAAVDQDAIAAAPLNTVADGEPIMVFRPSPSSAATALIRRVHDLRPQFHLRTSANDPATRHGRTSRGARPSAGKFVDADTGSTWTIAGVWVSGPAEFKGIRLLPIPVDEDVDDRVMKYWYPELKMVDVPHPSSNALAVGE
jgi:Protein of unknown function (DUF3179)